MTPSEIRAVRDRLGLNQTDFAQLLNVSRNTVTKWENGRSTPSLLKEDMIRQYDRQARESDDNEFIRQFLALAAGGAFGALLGKLFSDSDSDS
jgi:DNA-binding XRE family transcriptional regulator